MRDTGRAETSARIALAALLLVLVGIYAGSINHPFHYDDVHSIVENPHIREWRNLPGFLVHPEMFSRDARGAMYRPLVLVSYVLNYALSGDAVWSYHVVNLALHAAAVVLLWIVLRVMGIGPWAAAGSCGLFAVHPLNAEVVNYISSRSESLCACGMLWCLAAYIHAHDRAKRSWRWELLGLMGFVLALLSKSVAVTLPGLLVLWEVVGTRAGIRRGLAVAVRRQWPYWMLTVAYLGMVRRMLSDAVVAHPVRTLTTQGLTQVKALIYYLELAVAPVALSVEHAFALSDQVTDPAVLTAAALLLSALAVGMAWGRRGGPVAFWLLSALVVLVPTLLVPLNVLVNEHRLYFSSAALAAAAGMLLYEAARSQRCGRLIRALAVTLVIFALLAAQRTAVWASPARLWGDALAKGATMPRPHIYMGDVYQLERRYQQALQEYEIALTVYPEVLTDAENVVIHNNIGATYLSVGDYVDAASAYEQALRLDSTYALARDGYDAATAMLGKEDNPEADRLRKLGLGLMIGGQLPAAVQRLRQSLQLRDDPQTWMALGMAYERMGDVSGAVRTYALLSRLHADGPYARRAAERVRALTGSP